MNRIALRTTAAISSSPHSAARAAPFRCSGLRPHWCLLLRASARLSQKPPTSHSVNVIQNAFGILNNGGVQARSAFGTSTNTVQTQWVIPTTPARRRYSQW